MNIEKGFKFIDLFAGVGGIRLGFEQACKDLGFNSECVFTSEIDDWACQTYRKNFPNDGHDPKSDVTKVDETQLPDFDVLLAGFPCQAFSIAGKRGGFNDTRGTLFFDVARIIKEKRPKAFLLENVKGLTNHRGGKTLEVIINTLKEDLGYTVFYKVLNAKDYGIPQNRERVFCISIRADVSEAPYVFPEPFELKTKLKDVLEENVDDKYYLSEKSIDGFLNHNEKEWKK